MNLSISLQQQQKMVMTLQMHQAFQLLQVTGQELEDTLLEEIRENPALELEEDFGLSEHEQQRIVEDRQRKADELEERNGAGEESTIDWDTLIEAGQMVVNKRVVGGYAFDDMPAFEENYASSSTLYDELMEQFRLELSTDGERIAGEFIIASLDDNGFLEASLEEVAMETDTDLDDVEGAILIIRELEPIGCAAQNMIESLVFQAEILHPEDPFFPDLI
jgi:RNA polymerase sigma-54 factor